MIQDSEFIKNFRNRIDFLIEKNQINEENQKLLTITQNHFDIYFVQPRYTVFAVINNKSKDSFIERDFRGQLDGDLNVDDIFDDEKYIAYLIKQNLLQNINLELIIPESFNKIIAVLDPISASRDFTDHWLKREITQKTDLLSKKQFELVTFNTNLFNKSKFDFQELIETIDDEQFTYNLSQILGAYNNGWFFVAASSIGSLMEYIYYETAVNYGKSRFAIHRDNPTHIDFQDKMRELRNFTKNFPEDQQIRFGNAEVLDMERGYLTRNAVSHHDSGFANVQEVETLFTALKRAYEHYFIPSLNYKKAHVESDQ
ncbi:hypothetical protein FOL01_0119 [Weissella jogaejeotgali]|uniref:Uncharacterized protein n=1 Tax=Weissella jogaejeotgali TaxID=1631871 RepID=A0A1L6R901_9LACO|nr:hypothetical protein [Weissella jogaejeotgali]APS40978.1 hypothetical protein FOL01_0119 [Weissella jogaejeotgali]